MKYALLKSAAVCALLTLCSLFAFGQVSTTGSISGTVADQSKAVVAGATIVVKNNATGLENTVTTADNGTFNVPALATGVYTVTISASNFKQTVVKDVKVNVGTPSNINVELEVGAVTETVTITGGGGELLQTQTATVGTTITGRQILDLPFTSRDALDLVLLLPGTTTPGSPRTSTVNGLPKGALNITLDGVNVQDNSQKSAFGGGFFTYVRPRIDAIDEVTVSTATPGAESSGEGAVQIKFVTRSGSSQFHGSLYEYHREPSFNANYFFNNKNRLPRDPVHLNQYGGRVGGPITIPGLFNTKRDKAFFFTNLEEFRLPEATSRTRTILNPLAQTGVFTTSSGAPINLLALAANTNCGAAKCASTIDPTIASLLSKIRSSTSQGTLSPADANRQSFSFTNIGGQLRRFAAVRLDYNINSKHHLENIWNYQRFGGADVDFLNSVDPSFPGFLQGVGGQHSLRFDDSLALRSTLTKKLINEARFGVQGGNSFFRDSVTPGSFSDFGGFSLTLGAGLTNPQASRSNSRRNSPVTTFTDTMNLVEGTHSFNFGGTYSRYGTYSYSVNNIVPAITFGLDATDPANAIFTVATTTQAGNFPIGTSTSDITLAQGIYALLTGHVTAVSANAYLDESTGKLTYLGPQVNRFRQNEYGLFFQDSWRYRPNLTLNLGLRWEVQEPFTSQNQAVTIAPFNQIFGISGPGNLFRPGANSGQVTQLSILQPGQKPYNTDFNNFLPSVGLAYSPDWKNGLLHRFLGGAGQTVLRTGYSIATVREGSNIASSILASNPGGVTDFSKSTSLSNAQRLTPGTLFSDRAALAPPALSTSPTFPFTGNTASGVNTFEPNLRIGYVQSWTAGIQREITKDMVVEARYVGNRGVKLWRQVNLNETNVIENGFANEYRLAQQNLIANIAAGRTVCLASNAAGTCTSSAPSYGYYGPNTGTSPLPITAAYLSGAVNPNVASSYLPVYTGSTCTANCGAQLYGNSTLLGQLSRTNPNPQGFAANLYGNDARAANAVAAGLPLNEFIVNPNYRGGAFLVTNLGRSYYDAFTLELRRRMAAGLLVQGSYTFGKALTNAFASNLDLFVNPPTFRNDRLGYTRSPFDIRHGFKADWIYELPFGRGRKFGGGMSKVADWLAGGWDWQGTTRLQSGTPFSFGNVQLVGMTAKDLQHAIEVRKSRSPIPTATGDQVLFLPDDIILNTWRAFNTSGTTANGYTQGAPTGRFIAPPGYGNCVQAYTGQCGFANLVVQGPRFFRFDTSVIKRVKFTENTNIEMRAEFLNAINNQNFRVGAAGNEVTSVTNFTSALFGTTTEAYRDLSTTNDPGGRIIQFVFRFNF